MSRFVPAGTEQSLEGASANDDAWSKAREKIDSVRQSRPAVSGEQSDGRSLYEVLQANKAAKQEAFEEATKLRNQFRPLDDSEIEFLDSVRATERRNEAAVKREAAEQLDAFRKQRALADQQTTERELKSQSTSVLSSSGNSLAPSKDPHNSWTTSKKRRRVLEHSDDNPAASKQGKFSPAKGPSDKFTTAASDLKTSQLDTKNSEMTEQEHDGRSVQKAETESAGNPPIALGLAAYDSDED